ncbi:MAG TPA: FAD/NAD(P)-binding protein, partial [Candidatus Tumulicola sp.]
MPDRSCDVDVAIVGGGYCGVMLAAHLSAVPDLRVAAFERDAWASGVAYATHNPRHLLNLRAGKMSAFPERDRDFVEWAGDVTPDDFLPRRLYGDYLRSVFQRSTEGIDRIHRLHSTVTSIVEEDGGFRVIAERESN